MFSSIGWGEIFLVVVLGLVIIGPERLPGVIKDVRAAIFAARKAINNAKAELDGELGSISSEFDTLRGPISQAAEWGRLGPRGALTKALFDGDDKAWDDFNPRKFLADDFSEPPATGKSQHAQQRSQHSGSVQPQKPQPRSDVGTTGHAVKPDYGSDPGSAAGAGGFSWADIT